MTKLQSILDIVREKNPETMELSLGCKIALKDGEIVTVTGFSPLDGDEYLCYWHDSKDYSGEGDELWKVLVTEMALIGHPLYPHHLIVAIDMPGDTRYESTVIKGDTITIAMPNGHATHFIDEINGTPGTNYDWAEFTLKIKEPLEPQLQANPELVETLYSLLTK